MRKKSFQILQFHSVLRLLLDIARVYVLYGYFVSCLAANDDNFFIIEIISEVQHFRLLESVASSVSSRLYEHETVEPLLSVGSF